MKSTIDLDKQKKDEMDYGNTDSKKNAKRSYKK